MQVEYHNGTGLLCVIGDPIGHSLSPLLQNTMLKELGEDYLYLALPVKAGTVEPFVSAAKAIGIRGFNLTMPHKEHIIPFLSHMTPEARHCGSVNTVRIIDGQLEGHSTDGLGFRKSLETFGRDFPGQTVTILGAGGAAKSIAMTAAECGAAKIYVANRTHYGSAAAGAARFGASPDRPADQHTSRGHVWRRREQRPLSGRPQA